MGSLARKRLSSMLLSSVKNTDIVRKMLSRGYADEMNFTFVAANQTFYSNQNVKQVDVPSFNGSFGILPQHVPILAVLKPGVVTVYEEGGVTKKVIVSSGTVTVNNDSSVQILAEEAHLLENIDVTSANEALKEAEKELSSAKTEQEKVEAQIAVDTSQAIIAAIGS